MLELEGVGVLGGETHIDVIEETGVEEPAVFSDGIVSTDDEFKEVHEIDLSLSIFLDFKIFITKFHIEIACPMFSPKIFRMFTTNILFNVRFREVFKL